MICPYLDGMREVLQQWTQEYSEEDATQTPTGTTKSITKYTPMSCARENCGAFYDGRCHYKTS